MHRLELITRAPDGPGKQTPLLFVHGAWHAAWCWDQHFLPYFAQHGYQCYALSLRGHGGSTGRERLRWTSIAEYVEDVAEVASRLAELPVVLGHSMGGLVVQKYLETHSARAGVLLASSPPAGALPFCLRYAARYPIPFLLTLLTLSPYKLIGTPQRARHAFFSRNLPVQQRRAYYRQLQEESMRVVVDMIALSLPRPQKVQTPLLVLGAEQDTIFTSNEVHATAKAYHTQAVMFPNMAHDMMLEAGWQAVADHILAWLQEHNLANLAT